eukprot:jgi/Mesvir1/28183/Mv04740-RA.1
MFLRSRRAVAVLFSNGVCPLENAYLSGSAARGYASFDGKCHLLDAGILRVQGQDAFRFLQGITSNDVRLLQQSEDKAFSQYTLLLTPQGKLVQDVFLHKDPLEDKNSVIVEVPSGGNGASVIDYLRRYKLRAKVEIDDARPTLTPWVCFGASSESLAQNPAWKVDPRLKTLGLRGVFPIASALATGSAPQGIVSHDSVLADSSVKAAMQKEYKRHRWQQGILEGVTEMPAGDAFPLEYNLGALNAISFTKGCYVGQELVARTQFRGVIRKRVLPFTFAPQQGAAPSRGQEVHVRGHGKKVGSVLVVDEEAGLGVAMLRLQEAFAAMSSQGGAAGSPGDLLAGEALISPYKPAWWPKEWDDLPQ